MSKLFLNAREPLSSYTHFIGLLLSVAGLLIMAVMVSMSAFHPAQVLGLLFCLSLIALYGASSLYHYVVSSPAVVKRLRKLDHAMIYVLIAGTYTPLLYEILMPPQRYIYLGIIWLAAALGILAKVWWINAPRWLGAGLYLLMGWFIAVDFPALKALPPGALALLIAGGVFYSIGAVIYILKKPNLNRWFGFHEIFHVFVIAGSICHYFMVLFYLI